MDKTMIKRRFDGLVSFADDLEGLQFSTSRFNDAANTLAESARELSVIAQDLDDRLSLSPPTTPVGLNGSLESSGRNGATS